MVQPNPGALKVSPLTGSEIVDLLGVEWNQTTTGAIAALSSNFSNDSPTNITSATGTTITAAQFLTGLINRTGPTANYTDTTDTAAAFAAAISPPSYPTSFYVDIKNAVPFIETLTGGTGVTFSSSSAVPPNSIAEFLVVLSSATTAVFNHVFTSPIVNETLEIATALSTVGAGTITGAGIAGRVTTRTGSTSAFTDTTDTAANIIAAQPNAHIGDSWEYTYTNSTVAVATLTGGTGVTVSAVTAVPANSWARYLVTYTAAATITMVGISQGFLPHSGTFTNNGASTVTTADANVTVGSAITITLKTVGGTVGPIPHLLTITPGTGFATVGTASDTSVYNYTILG